MKARFVVRGRVQGVFFRATTHEVADRIGIVVKVWNRDDGAVECLAEGTADQLGRLESFLRRGPPDARVESVERRDEP